MTQHIKTGHLRYFHKGFLSKKWKDYYFVLFDDSTLQWFEKQSDRRPEGSIRIRNVAQNLCVGPYTRCLPNRPQLPRPTDESNLIALPRSAPGHHDNEVVWILCNDVTHLNDWMKAIVSTLPPPPMPPNKGQDNNFKPSAPLPGDPPPPYPTGAGGPQRPVTPQVYPQLPGNPPQQPYRPPYGGAPASGPYGQPNYHTTVVVQPTPNYGGYHRDGGVAGSSLAGVGLGLAGGALLGGALGYAWGGGFGNHGGWCYGMGPSGYYGNYGGWGGGNETNITNNYYDNDTTNNYTNNENNTTDFSTYNDNNFSQNPNSFQYDTNNGNDDNDFGGGNDYYQGGDYGGDFGGNTDGYGGGFDSGDYGGGDFGGGDYGGGDFGGGDW